jgi:hypothetical protein
MTQDEIIEMARQAGFEEFDKWCEHYPQETQRWCQRMEAFAKLVAAKEREVCTAAAMTAAEEAIEFAIKLEREACHSLRQTLPNPHTNCQVSAHAYDMAIVEYGRAIRARGEA